MEAPRSQDLGLED